MSEKIIRGLKAEITTYQCRIKCLEEAQQRQAKLIQDSKKDLGEWQQSYREMNGDDLDYVTQVRRQKRASKDGGKTWYTLS